MEEEMFINGFCRGQNQGRMVEVVANIEQGKKILAEVDCAYGQCPHQASCEIARQIQEYTGS